MPYSLPMLQYDMKVSRTLTACPEAIELPAGSNGIAGHYRTDGAVVELAVTATGAQIPGERYRVDYSKLDSAFKTTSFTIEYQPGSDLLKSVNVSVEDHTGEVIANTVKAGLAIASVAAGPAGVAAAAAAATAQAAATSNKDKGLWAGTLKGIGPFANIEGAWAAKLSSDADTRQKLIALVDTASPSRQLFVCATTTLAKLERRKIAAKALKDATKAMTDLTTEVDQYTKIATIKALSPVLRDALSLKAEALVKATWLVAEKKKDLETIDGALGAAQSEIWPATFADRDAATLAALETVDRDRLARLFETTPETAKVIDPNTLAKALVGSPDLAAFRTVAKAFVDKYVDEDDAARSFDVGRTPQGCGAPTPDLKTCLASLTHLRAALTAVSADDLPLCTDDKPGECRRNWTKAAAIEADKQAAAKAENEQRRSALPLQVNARSEASQSGLFVRPPVRATLLICRAPSTGEDKEKNGCAEFAANLVKDDKVSAPQLGQLRYLRLVNEAFSNNGLVLNLSKDGAIEKFQYSSSKAIAQGLTAAAADAATQAAAWDKQRRDEHDKNSNPLLKPMQDEIALRAAEQTLAAFSTVKTPSVLELIQIDKARADVALSQAQATFVAAQTAILTSRILDP